MGMSRREFFKQMFGRRTLESLNPLPTRQIQAMFTPPKPPSCEEAGLDLMNRSQSKTWVDVLSAFDSHENKTQGPGAVVDTGRNKSTGE